MAVVNDDGRALEQGHGGYLVITLPSAIFNNDGDSVRLLHPDGMKTWSAEKVRKARYDLEEAEVKPYFPLDAMVQAFARHHIEADKWIADQAGRGDVVVTGDIPLAAKVIAAGAVVVKHNGEALTGRNIGNVLAIERPRAMCAVAYCLAWRKLRATTVY